MATDSITKLLIADDHPLFAGALTMAAHVVDPAVEVTTVATLAEAGAAARGGGFGLVLLDLMLPDVEGFGGLLLLRAMLPGTPIAIVSSRDDIALMRQAAAHGARGFLPKASSVEQTAAGIRVLLAGGQWFADQVLADTPAAADGEEEVRRRLAELSVAQLRVLTAIASGRQNKQVAHDLGLTEATVKSHLVAIFRKLGVANRTQAVMAIQSTQVR